MMDTVLEYIKNFYPKLLNQVEYCIIEISPQLSQKQKQIQEKYGTNIAKVVHKSIFDWEHVENRPCFVIGMEVLDNLSHDLVRYSSDNHQPLQGKTLIKF